jgi:hypothetical protein
MKEDNDQILFCMFGGYTVGKTEVYIDFKAFKDLLSFHRSRHPSTSSKGSFIIEHSELPELRRSTVHFLNTRDPNSLTRPILDVASEATKKGQPVYWMPCKSGEIITA